MVIREVHEIGFIECGAELPRQDVCILKPDPERNDRSNVAENSGAHLFVQLGDILVGENEMETVLSRLGEDVGEGEGDEVVELIDVEVETIFASLPASMRGSRLRDRVS